MVTPTTRSGSTPLKQVLPLALLLVVVAAELAGQAAAKKCDWSGGLCCSKHGIEAARAKGGNKISLEFEDSKKEIDDFFENVGRSHKSKCKCVLQILLRNPDLLNDGLSRFLL